MSLDALIDEIKKDYVSPKSLDLKIKKIKVKDSDGNDDILEVPYSTRYNLHQILGYHHRFDSLFWDDFMMKIYFNGQEIQDHELTRIVIWLERVYKIVTTEDILKKVVLLVAKDRARNQLKEYLDSFIDEDKPDLFGWDGVQRLKNVFTQYFGVEPSIFKDENGNEVDLIEIYSEKFFVGAVRRALFATLEKPVQHDVVLILMGAQGIRKSTALQALSMKNIWFSDEELDLTSKDAKYHIQGKLLYELAEWSGRGKNIQREKAFFTRKTDRYRPVHGTFQIEVPRRCSFAVSTNRKSLLNDSTGSRRYWAMECGVKVSEDGWNGKKLPIKALKKIAPQLWLEARYIANNKKFEHWLTEEEEIARKEINYVFTSEHPWLYRIREKVGADIKVRIPDLMNLMDLSNHERSYKSKTIIEMCLKQLGFAKTRLREEGVRAIIWIKK